MEYRQLGQTDIKVSALCLGTMTWGQQNTEAEAHEQMDHALASGINFFDTAELYPVPPMAETQGLTEKYIGSWLRQRGRREEIILTSKVCGAADWAPHIRDGQTRLDTAHIEAALDASLKRLQTDYLDLYQTHWPDRHTNYFGSLGYQPGDDGDAAPIEETLAALGRLVEKGKVRHIGVSNETPWGVMQYLQAARAHRGPRLVSIQNPYNLLNRSFEIGLAEFSQREAIGLLAYSPLGFGVLSGKYLHGQQPEAARLTLFERFSRYTNPQGIAATEAYVALARQHDLDPAQMALAYVTSRPFVSSNIIGATSMDQLRSNIASLELTLSAEILDGIEEIHRQYPLPCP